MSRVMLFIQTGDARPKFGGIVNGPLLHWCKYDISEDSAALVFVPGVGNYKAASSVHLRRARADRWWLVECANADAGRTLIALADMFAAARRMVPGGEVVLSPSRNRIPAGRILASGGRHG